MPRTILSLTALAMALAVPAVGQTVHRESIEWSDSWMPHMNEHGLPRALLIGDSISKGYYPAVETSLAGKAYVARIATSKAIGDPALLAEIKTLMAQARFAVVHFNIGMHGWAYSEADYRRHLPSLVKTIRKAAPGAKLIWASTTPIRKDSEKGATNSRIEERNAIAREYMASQAIPVNDLHALMMSRGSLHTDNVHYNKEGSAIMGEQVAREIARVLPEAQR